MVCLKRTQVHVQTRYMIFCITFVGLGCTLQRITVFYIRGNNTWHLSWEFDTLSRKFDTLKWIYFSVTGLSWECNRNFPVIRASEIITSVGHPHRPKNRIAVGLTFLDQICHTVCAGFGWWTCVERRRGRRWCSAGMGSHHRPAHHHCNRTPSPNYYDGRVPDGRVVSGALFEATPRVWDPSTGVNSGMNPTAPSAMGDENRDMVRSLVVLPDGRVVSGGVDEVRVWR